jgi:osmotically-inducible protein OsmY
LLLRGDAAIEVGPEELVASVHRSSGDLTVRVTGGNVTLAGTVRLRSTVEHAG